jgi:hypothetical protein
LGLAGLAVEAVALTRDAVEVVVIDPPDFDRRDGRCDRD